MEATLEVLTTLWKGERVDLQAGPFELHAAQQRPVPLDRIPIVIGGTGPRTLKITARFADWWNAPVGAVPEIERYQDQIGSARMSVLQVVCYRSRGEQEQQVTELARRRFSWATDLVIGGDARLVDHFSTLAERGVERSYMWFTDFAMRTTLEDFAAGVASVIQ
jgi:alkanesulfonate monooxygenase SsuD/methylene tetrahydromethanopterin reductase-like flavin-dependent oxidoreductase (luciferase family)